MKSYILNKLVQKVNESRINMRPKGYTQSHKQINKILNAKPYKLSSEDYYFLTQNKTRDDLIISFLQNQPQIIEDANTFNDIQQKYPHEIHSLIINNTIRNEQSIALKHIWAYIQENFTTKEQKELAQKVNINNFKSTNIYYDILNLKLTPEQLKQQNENDYFVFLAKKSPYQTGNDSNGDPIYKLKLDIENLYKVNPNDAQSNLAINMMKMRGRAQGDLQLYGIRVGKGLLDEYSGKSSSQIPNYILSGIEEFMFTV